MEPFTNTQPRQASRAAQRALLWAAALTVLACDAGSLFGPGRHQAVSITYCATPEWAKVSDAGAPWRTLTVDGPTVKVDVGPRTTVAVGMYGATEIYSLSADELANVGCHYDQVGTAQVTGTVAGIDSTTLFLLSAGPTLFAYRTGPGTFSLPAPPTPRTLIASARPNFRAAAVIIKPNVDFASSASLGTFDFASSTALAIDSAALTIAQDATTNQHGSLLTDGATVHSLVAGPYGATKRFLYGVNLDGMPQSMMHRLDVSGIDRGMSYFYRSVHPVQLELGPVLNLVGAAVTSNSPCLRMRAELPLQPEYPALVAFTFISQIGPRSGYSVTMYVSKAFLGASPATWRAEVPDLRRPGGACILPSSATWYVTATAFSDVGAAYQFIPASDGAIRRWARGYAFP